jgi:serine/threonine-protein kinase
MEDPAPGLVLGGRYRLERELGAGGMGTVWEAVQLDLGRRVAVKLLHARHAGDAELRERFFREARTLASLGQPGIVTLLDFAPDAEAPYLVMERLVGESLRARLARDGRLPLREAVRIARAVLAALAAAHDAGIVHRDVKPENIFLCDDPPGFPKLLDFGVAKSQRAAPLTAEGLVVGTLAYMAPEQVRGDALDARADVYAVAAVLFECIAGRRPLRGGDRTELVRAILADSPPLLSDVDASVPTGLAAAVDRALRKSKDARFSDARSFRDALLPFEEPARELASAPPPTLAPARGASPGQPSVDEVGPTLLAEPEGVPRRAPPKESRTLAWLLVAALLVAASAAAYRAIVP